MIRPCILGIASLLLTGLALADEKGIDKASPHADEPALEVVLVTGEQPGPALWKVSTADHVLWILGEVSPVPRKMKWRSKQFERQLAESQEVLLETEQVSQACREQRAASNSRPRDFPDARTLKDVLSPELYARVETVSEIYGERERIEKLHPFAATTHLWNRVPFSLKLRIFGASVAVNELARKSDVRVTWIPLPCMTVNEAMPSEFPAACVVRVLDVIEDGGSGLRRLANAWSIGDIDELRHLVPSYAVANESHHPSKCSVAVTGEQWANELVAKRTESWLNEAERALRENQSTMAVVPMAELFALDGWLASLRAKGYEVVEPK